MTRRDVITAYRAVFRLEENGHAPCGVAGVPGTDRYRDACADLDRQEATTSRWRQLGARRQAIYEHAYRTEAER